MNPSIKHYGMTGAIDPFGLLGEEAVHKEFSSLPLPKDTYRFRFEDLSP